MRIHGRIGDWPVDLTVELDGAEWAQLRGLPVAAVDEAYPVAAPATAPSASAGDRLWALAQELLRRAGALDGPQLFAELSALAGGEEAGKRLLVRLRHCPQVEVQAAGDAPVYRWTGAAADQ
ncbi:hypothetical protein [Pseudomonas sp. AN-1]|uniref:hypothetical protein n=1 Tax=Pseudomonas sp. AN-1 TaxID=3096605 RepID=UPI002A6B2EA0|nr:hypothetical protein [Pseudomonas sp. AN-1]WPP44866.1 hypothetical protein SK095_16670 [Pseudomonas sp. AN-1]